MYRRMLSLCFVALVSVGCAMSRENEIAASDVRVCIPPLSGVEATVYIVAADDPGRCLVAQGFADRVGGGQLNDAPCDEIGWSRDGTRTPVRGRPLDDVVVSAEGTLQYGSAPAGGGVVNYDIRVTVVEDTRPARLVHAAGSWGPYVSGDTGCYLITTPSP